MTVKDVAGSADVEVGRDLAGAVFAGTVFPAPMLVDDIRGYQPEAA